MNQWLTPRAYIIRMNSLQMQRWNARNRADAMMRYAIYVDRLKMGKV